MNIQNYFKEVKEKINRINKYVSNPINYRNINNPFISNMPKTYVWIEEDKKKY